MNPQRILAGICVLSAMFFGLYATTQTSSEDAQSPQTPQATPLPADSLQSAPTVDDEKAMLYRTFPAVASEILDAPGVLIPIGDIHGSSGFALALSDDMDPAGYLPAILPSHGTEPVQFLMGTNKALTVQPSGTRGPGRVVGNAIAYDADHGTSYWVATKGGYEEWLMVDHPRDGIVASYEVEGASPAQRGDSIVLLADDGLAVLEVDAPAAWTTDGRAVHVRLEVQDTRINLTIELPDDVRGPVLVDPVWSRVDDLGFGRMLHTATRLLDGRVLATGGIGEAGLVIDNVDIFDPRTDSWTSAAPLSIPLRSHGAVLLADGRVMVFHGKSNGFSSGKAFIYDLQSDTWTEADAARSLVGGPGSWIPNRGVALPNGQVLFSGKYCCTGKEAWVYDPEADLFHPIMYMNVHRLAHSLTVLPDGSVLAAGGGTLNASGLNSNTAELYVPDFASPEPYLNGSWVQLPDMSSGHMDHGAVLLTTGPNAGKALVCSGLDGATIPGSFLFTPDCELYDPETRTFTPAASVAEGRQRSGTNNGGEFLAIMEAGPNEGDVLFAGGWPLTWRTDLYDANDDVWTEGCWLNAARLRHTTTALTDGTVVLTGGQSWAYAPYSTPIRDAERIDFTHDDDDCDGIANAFDICEDNPVNRDYNPVDNWCGAASGRVYFDENEDCLDNGEPGASGVLIRAELPGQQTRYAVTNADGVFELDLPDGQWDISMVDRDYLEPVGVCGGIAKMYAVDPIIDPGDLDFGLKPGCEATVAIAGFDPQGANIQCNGMPYATPCPGNDWQYLVTLGNQGSPWTPGNPGSTLTVTLPEGMDYIGPTVSPCLASETAVLTNPTSQWVVTYDLTNVGTGAICQFVIPVYVDSIPVGGWEAIAELNAQCGGNTLNQTAGVLTANACSCDPNDKAVYPRGCDLDGTIDGAQSLDYTVRFQNLGLGPAHHVIVTDEIDPDLELESLQLTYSSHLTNLQIDETGRVVIRYEDIELPAAVDDPLGSMGGFQYRIEPAITDLGTQYTNSADIYFDQNEVVITNEVVNTIGVCDLPPGHDPFGPARAGVGNGTNPGQGGGLANNPAGGNLPNPNNAP